MSSYCLSSYSEMHRDRERERETKRDRGIEFHKNSSATVISKMCHQPLTFFMMVVVVVEVVVVFLILQSGRRSVFQGFRFFPFVCVCVCVCVCQFSRRCSYQIWQRPKGKREVDVTVWL